MRPLPPLNALVAFEAVARTGSVGAAADELFVTPGAVSRQLKVLDDYFATNLFERQGRGLALSPTGADYFHRVTGHIEGLRSATAAMRSEDARTIVRLHSYTTFATRWLIPRLGEFQVAHPQIEIRLTTSSEGDTGHHCDAEIRLGGGHWPGFEATPLVRNVLVAVCSPALVQRSRPLDGAWLAEQTLLRVDARPDDWNTWCAAAGIDPTCMSRQRVFENSALAYEAAQAGLGVVVAQEFLVGNELASGKLIAPIDARVDRGNETYYLVIDDQRRERAALVALRDALGAASP
ncbi:LysR family transcriptional regulator, glycine cleavage system transcriptional activator [Luteibacter sp. UNCMF331Sha3.1]|uniref:LysR substrate-binding domain-containing protein n=1 Tax=Luteibacter sp. UNCMF331Sha3.1 TaxID=1502760 RepID=UPI0008B8C7EB|nr:LysR substrate-binding domain-containing protein [Luteibacter sp. UNCMF331Sha3.1]SEM39718.1 LysR family transcriptional regulator, glycine cleavage system transcriptional activator [Luteibacter sp. UNCMF331Sha3.1]